MEMIEEAGKNYIEKVMNFSFNSLETKVMANRMLKCVKFGYELVQNKQISQIKNKETLINEFIEELFNFSNRNLLKSNQINIKEEFLKDNILYLSDICLFDLPESIVNLKSLKVLILEEGNWLLIKYN